jgi:hypothetical protein
MMIAIMVKTMNERCLSAQSERLGPIMTALQAVGPSVPGAVPARPR